MIFSIKSLLFFTQQVSKLDNKSKRIIYDKIQLLKENPYRYKRVHSKQYSKVFRIRLNIQSEETRLIYVIIEPNIILVCLLDRKQDYRVLRGDENTSGTPKARPLSDLEKYLKKLKQELSYSP